MGDGDWLTVGEVVTRTGLDKNKVREYADAGYFLTWRPPGVGPGTPHRRISAESVDAFLPIYRMPPGPERQAELDELRRRNRGEAGA